MSRFINTVIGSSIGVLLGVGSAFGNPTDPTVVSGSANFQSIGSQLNVTNSNGAIIDWNSFSIGQDEITRFVQQSASSAVLNRVTGGSLSEILGDLQSNGRVFLINPNGLIVGQDAVIDTAGFVGSTLDISNQAFSSGDYSFNGEGGVIENRGLIHVSGSGDIALIASSVENSGVLRTDNGDITLAAGKSVSLSFEELPNLSFEVQSPDNQVTNLGNIIAAGGSAALVGGRISNNGNVELVESPDGRIFLHATDLAEISGGLDSNGGDIHAEARQLELRDVTVDTASNGIAGDISLLGDNVGLFAGTKVNATGDSGGGTVLIGGEQQGRGDTRRSEFVYLDRDASVNADGGINGDGGTVILFAENSARINGELSARGGLESGDGGFIETSGLIGLEVNATPNAGADNGAAGTWLIDPNNIEIVFIEGPAEQGIEETFDADTVFTAVAAGAILNNDTIENALQANNVVIDTGTTGTEAGDITINTDINSESGNSLTFNAARNININGNIRVTVSEAFPFGGPTVLQFNSNQAGTGGSTNIDGVITLTADAIEFNGGGLTIADFSELVLLSSQVDVVGGLDQIGSVLEITGGPANIDQLTLNMGVEGGPIINADPSGDVTIGFLNINLPGDPMVSSSFAFAGGDFILLDGGSIALQVDPLQSAFGAQFAVAGNLINQGTLTITGEGNIDFGFDLQAMPAPNGGALTNAMGATINVDGGIGLGSVDPIVNNGTFNVNEALGPVLNPVVGVFADFQNNSLININPGAMLELAVLTMNQGEVHLDGGGILSLLEGLSIEEGSSITGSGIIESMTGVSVESGGILAPGNSPGALLFGTDLTLFDGAILNVELAGASPGEFDVIDVMGNLNVGGPGASPADPGVVLNIINLGGYNPDPMQSHDILQVGGTVTQSATPFSQSATGFDTLDVGFNATGTLGVVVSVTPPVDPTPPTPPVDPTPPATPVDPAPQPPIVEMPVAETPIVEQPPVVEPEPMMTPPDDVINDVLAFDAGRPEPRLNDGGLGGGGEEGDDEIRTLENQCR